MKLIIGGAYQGKLAYAKEAYGIEDGWIDGRSCAMEEIWACSGISFFHEYIRRMMTGTDDQTDADDLEEADDQSRIDGLAEADADTAAFVKGLTAVSIEEQAALFIKKLHEKNPEIVIIANELGCGVVPVERFDRMWRELVGRMCVCAAEYADEVVRVVCGLGMKLKPQ